METLTLMARLWPLVVGIAGVIGAVAVLFYRVQEHGKILKNLEDVEKVVGARLYTKDGMTIYMPRLACDQCRTECHSQMVEKFASIEKLFSTRFDSLESLIRKNL